MGYTNYFKPTREVTEQEFKQFVSACRKLYKNLPEKTNMAGGYHEDDPLQIAGGDGTGKPEFNKNFVCFNGLGDELNHEGFIIEIENKEWDFCKTDRKPYDLLVMACLIAAWQFIDYRFSSDGFHDYKGEKHIEDLQPAVDYYNKVMKPKTPITEEMLWLQREEYKLIENGGVIPDEKLPVAEQKIPDLQGGLFLCKSFSPKPFWVIYGNVDKPTFLKTRIYKDDLYNDIYRDKQGYAYMLMPLMPISNSNIDFVTENYEIATQIGLRENINFIMPLIYNLGLVNLIEVAKQYMEFYSQEELHERFETVLRNVSMSYTYNGWNGFVYRDRDKKFSATTNALIQTKCDILTCLTWAIKDKKKVAAIMSDVLKQTFSHIEFENTL